MTIITDAKSVTDFVAEGLWQGRREFGEATGIGFLGRDGIVAGVVYHNWEPDAGTIELSAYSSRRDWLTRERLGILFGYPFDQIGCRLAVARISERNTRALRIWRALGAMQTPVPELRGPGEAEVISVLTKDTWQNGKFAR